MPLKDANGDFLGSSSLGSIVYEMDYFCGSNLFLMVGDILIDTAISLRYDTRQSKTPIYGYAQQYYSFVASGHVLVQGTLAVAFKESAYMLHPIQRFSNNAANVYANRLPLDNEEGAPSSWNNPRYTQDSEGNIINSYKPKDYTFAEASRKATNKRVAKGNVEQMFEWQAKGGNPKQYERFNKLNKQLGALKDNDFEDWAEVFEDAIWYGADKANPMVRDKLYSRNIPRNQEIDDEDVLNHRRIDQYPPVDLTIVYGDASRNPTNHTVRKILDVVFTGQAQTVETDGNPVYDVYEFIARTTV